MRLPLLALIAALPLAAQNVDWKPLEFLLGKWTGVADAKHTEVGPGTGACSFELDLNKNVIIRKSTASYDSGVKHDDLMVIYYEGAMRAIYFDSEGHVIRYNVTSPATNRVVFLSEPSQPGPKYRLTYWTEGALVHVDFEIAAKGDEYKMYAGGLLKRE